MDIDNLLSQCMIADRFWLKKQYQKIHKYHESNHEEQLLKLQEKIAQSIQKRENRVSNLPKIVYPDLPILLEKENILKALQHNQVIIVAGETGSGKTTQLPKICLEAGLGIGGMIGHTQPRRIAARTVATRIAAEFESALGQVIGYKVRFSDNTQPHQYIKIMTDGILLTETQSDRWLEQYDCLIIDEAHERSLNIDFLLGYLRNLSSKRKDLKIIVTSATIDVERFSKFFHDAPIIEVSGRSYPVEVQYLGKDFHANSDDPILQVAQAVELACKRGPGDILIFQSGEKEIREVIDVLSTSNLSKMTLLPLFARMSLPDQQKVFQSAPNRKIIVTTNVAETSLTVPNIRYVIDSGLARISRYNYRNKLQRLPIEPISQASADQRKGRCGRVGPGICYRLYSEDDFLTRAPFTEPEILRTNLAGVILKMLSLNLDNIETFPFLEAPDSRFIKDGYTLLERLQAVDEDRKITRLGRVLATIPIEPKLGRIIIAANEYGALNEVLIIASALSIVDVRERPEDCKEQADAAHAKFTHENSDFMSYLLLWNFIDEHRQNLSHSKFRKLCRTNFLSYLRVCEWIDVHTQLHQIADELGFRKNQVPADFSLIHKSLLCGFIDTIGVKDDNKEYQGARNVKFFIHPASSLFKKSPSWVLSCEIIHTSKTYARTNAAIETKWIEEVAQSLLKKQHVEPYFEPKAGRVVALERATLFGLEIYAKRKINYEKVSPIEARKIFIEQALVQELMISRCSFYTKNKETRHSLEKREDRIRRQHILFDESKVVQFYQERIPFHICSVQRLEKFLADKNDDFLVFTEDDISLMTITSDLNNQFPAQIIIKGQSFQLEYEFDLSSPYDGVTLIIPFETLKYIKDEDFTWLIPGLLEEKIATLLKALPKRIRAYLVPLPDHIHKAKQMINSTQGDLPTALMHYLQTQITLPQGILNDVNLPPHLIMHFKVKDKHEKVVAMGDDLKKIYEDLKSSYLELHTSEEPIEKENIIQWDFSDLPGEYKIRKGTLDFNYFPGLVDNQQSVSIRLFDAKALAEFHHPFGLARLYLLQLSDACKNFKRSITPQEKKLLIKTYAEFGDFEQLIEEILFNCAMHLFVSTAQDIRTQKQFSEQLAKMRSQFILSLNQIKQCVTDALPKFHDLFSRLEKLKTKPHDVDTIKDIRKQLQVMFPKHFIKQTPFVWLKRYPAYLKAIDIRLEKLPRQLAKDKQARLEIESVQKAYDSKLATKDISLRSPQDPLISFRWKIEELRISSFAQELKTIEPVSKARLLKLLENIG